LLRYFKAKSISVGIRKKGSDVLLILVNTRNQQLPSAEISIPGLGSEGKGTLMQDGSTLTQTNGKARVSFEPLGVKVYQFIGR
jgi:hypothetical protein